MALSPGTRLGVYEVTAQIGAGGMGQVYRATDTKLKRQVAIKILPPSVAADADRLARFQREAEVLASLNHPHIAGIYGLEESAGITALVMELVEGDDLSQRIARGAIPVDEALPIAKQIAEALEAAHEQGIIHRDLKPANIKVRPDGTVKVLDFGLAKAMDVGSGGSSGAGGPGGLSMSPTMMSPAQMSGIGVILGTAAYMAPEQAKGKSVDRRADIWAFGVVLYEMLTGQGLFDAEDLSETLAAVLTRDVDLTSMSAAVPARVRALLRDCLIRDPRQRLRDIGDARIVLDKIIAGAADDAVVPTAATPPFALRRQTIPLVIGSVLATALVAMPATWMLTRPPAPATAALMRFSIGVQTAQPLSAFIGARDVAIAPDGLSIVYRSSSGRQGQLALRRLDQLDSQPLTGTTDAHGPFFSADGRWIGFFAAGEMRKVSISGGAAISLGGVGIGTRGASWTPDNAIVFATDAFPGLRGISSDGRPSNLHTKPDDAQHEIGHWFPFALPDGRGVLFTVAYGEADSAQIAVLDLKSGERKTLVRGGSDAQYVAAPGATGHTGYLVYAAGGALRAVRFDAAKLEVIGDPVQVLDHVMVANSGEANFALSPGGTLVYVSGGVARADQRQLVWVDRNGREEPISAPPRAYVIPRISPDGTRLAIQLTDEERDIWTWDLARRALTRVTFDPGLDVQPVWTADSRRIIFASARRNGAFNLFSHAADGTGHDEPLTDGANQQFPNSVTPDGAQIVGYQVTPKGASSVVQFPLKAASAAQRPAEPLVQTATGLMNVEMSPDGRFVAYQSDESGTFEIYVRPYPNTNDARWQVSAGGGVQPAWARNGRELFFMDPAGALTSVAVQTAGGTFTSGKPVVVVQKKYSTPLPFRAYDVSPDGQRFLMLKESVDASSSSTTMNVVLNWTEELRTKLAGK